MSETKLVAADSTSKHDKEKSNLLIIYSYILIILWSLFIAMVSAKPKVVYPSKNGTKYILEWAYAISYSGCFTPHCVVGPKIFIERNCSIRNCYMMQDRSYFGDVSKYDAVLFNSKYTINLNFYPPKRSPKQKYIFVAVEPPAYLRYWSYHFRKYYNWSMTYRLGSDIPYPFLTIRDMNGNIVGPKKDMTWIDDETIKKTSIQENLKRMINNKTKTVAWFVTRCNSVGKREILVHNLEKELQNYGLHIDVYGGCSRLKCSIYNQDCLDMLGRDYHFYLAFENSFSEDYVTEKLLRAMRYGAVPIVYGGGNYSSYVPAGAYLDASKLNVKELAITMNELIKNKELYYDYFKWHNFYIYHDPVRYPDSDPFCRLCAMLHDEDLVKEKTVISNFLDWWDPDQAATFNRSDKAHNEIIDGHISGFFK